MNAKAEKKEAKAWSQTFKTERGKLQLFEYTSPGSGKVTLYFTHPTESLPCGSRTRSLRHGDRETAVRWAEEIIASGIPFDEIPEIPKAQADGVKPSKPKAKRSPKGKAVSKKSTKKARR